MKTNRVTKTPQERKKELVDTAERLFLEMVQAGVSRAHLDELFPGPFGDADLDLLRRVTLGERLVPDAVRWNNALPRLVASNNWAVAPRKTRDGHAIAAYDPHLETNRLPAIWYEVVLEPPDRWCVAATMPGVPALLFGRTDDLVHRFSLGCQCSQERADDRLGHPP